MKSKKPLIDANKATSDDWARQNGTSGFTLVVPNLPRFSADRDDRSSSIQGCGPSNLMIVSPRKLQVA